MRHLKAFRINGREITDAGLFHLKGMNNLEVLAVVGTARITDDGLRAIAAMKSLREVAVELGPDMTEDGLASLAELPKLEIFTVSGGKKLPAATLELLRNKMPNCPIEVK